MGPTTLTQLIPVLQLAIGPVILISGVGLLLLSMTNPSVASRTGRGSWSRWPAG